MVKLPFDKRISAVIIAFFMAVVNRFCLIFSYFCDKIDKIGDFGFDDRSITREENKMTENITIRKITAADREDFIRMSREFYSSDAVLHDVPADFHERAFAELMRSEDYLSCYIFDTGEGNAAGYAMLNKMFMHECGGVVVWIEELYVRSEYRGKGLGHRFFEFLEKNVDAARYRLEVEPDNSRAVELYRRLGYSPLPYMQMVKDRG